MPKSTPEAWDGGPAKGRGARMNCSKVSFNVVLSGTDVELWVIWLLQQLCWSIVSSP